MAAHGRICGKARWYSRSRSSQDLLILGRKVTLSTDCEDVSELFMLTHAIHLKSNLKYIIDSTVVLEGGLVASVGRLPLFTKNRF